MNTKDQSRLDAQAQQMAFELGYASSPVSEVVARPTFMKLATEKQFSFIKKLVGERELGPMLEREVAEKRSLAVRGKLSASSASSLIDGLLAAPKKAETAPESAEGSELRPGIYEVDGKALFRVYLGQQSGHLLVKLVDIDEDGNVSYEYQGAASRVFRSMTPVRLSLEEVGKLGIESGTCLVCGRRLDDPESVDRGIGPVCAQNY